MYFHSGVFSTSAKDALAPAINIGTIYYCHRPLAPAILEQSIIVSTCNSKVLNTPLAFSIALYQKWLRLNVLQFFSLISDCLGGVYYFAFSPYQQSFMFLTFFISLSF